MASSPGALAAAGSWWVSEPCLWGGLAALFVGLALGQALRACVPIHEPRVRSLHARPHRIARSIAFLSLGLLALVGLLVFVDKAVLAEALSASFSRGGMVLLPWACVVALIGLLSGFRPFVLGLPLAFMAALACVLLSLCLEGWLPFRAAGGEGYRIARLLPYEVGASSFRGQLETAERDSVPVLQELSFDSNSVALSAESLELSGPLGLAAKALTRSGGASGPGNGSASARFYRIVGIVAPGGREKSFVSPPRTSILNALVPKEAGSALYGTVKKNRRVSEFSVLLALEPVVFSLDSDALRVLRK
jgi:hypothetical protein